MEANTSKQDKTWKIFINGKYTGESFVQPAIANYAFYASHSPAKHDHTAFDLKVKVDTDLSDVPVEVKSNDGLSMTESASKSDPVVCFSIPENTSCTDDRVLSIYVNGEHLGDWKYGYSTFDLEKRYLLPLNIRERHTVRRKPRSNMMISSRMRLILALLSFQPALGGFRLRRNS